MLADIKIDNCEDLTSTEKVVYAFLCYSDFYEKYEAYPTQKTIAEFVNISERQVRRIVKSLSIKGYIVIEQIRKWAQDRTKNVYHLIKQKIYDIANNSIHKYRKTNSIYKNETLMAKGRASNEVIADMNNLYDESTVQVALKRVKKYVKDFECVGFETYLDKVCQSIIKEQHKEDKPKNKNYNNYKKHKSMFNDFEQRTYDFDDLERKLLGWDKPNDI